MPKPIQITDPQEDPDSKDPLVVDATISHRSTDVVELTKYPVERGQNPTDHARLHPPKFVMEGLFSNTKGALHKPGEAGPAEFAATRLQIWLSARKPLAIATDSTFFNDMMMTSLDIVRDQRTGDAVRFSASFEGVVFVNSEMVALEAKPVDAKKPVAKKDQGKKQPIPVETGSSQEATILKTGANYFGWTTPGSGVLK